MDGLLINIIVFSVGAKFLTLGIGAREIAMGSIGSVLVRDANATYFNPALLSLLDKGNLSLMHSNYLLDMRMESVSLSHPFGRIFTGFNLYGFFVSEIEGREGPSETFRPFGASFLNTNLSLSTSFFKNLSFGVTFKNIYERIDNFSSSSFAFDMGFVYKPEKSYFEIGGAISNIGGKLKLNSENFELPSSFKIGAGFYYKDASFAMEIFKIFKENTEFKIGGEYFIKKILALRAGYVTGYSQTHPLAGFRAGFGIKYRNFNFDYAFQPYGDLGNVHRISMGFAFAPLKIKFPERKKVVEPEVKKERFIKEEVVLKPIFNLDSLYLLALEKFKDKNFEASFELFFKIVYVDDKFKDVSQYFNKVREELLKEKIDKILKDVDKKIEENNLLDAYAILNESYISLNNPELLKNKLIDLENIIGKKAGLSDKEKEILRNALSFYSDKKYRKAIIEFKKIGDKELIRDFISYCESKRENFLISLQRDLSFYVKNEYYEKAYDVIKKLEEEGFYSTEFMVTRTRVQKELEKKSQNLLIEVRIYEKNKNYADALIFISKILDTYPLEEAKKIEEEILKKTINKKELYEDLMKKAILLFNEGKKEESYMLWKEIEKLRLEDKRLKYVGLYKSL